MTLMIALVAILGIAAAAGWFARSRATGLRGGGGRLHSLPNYHGVHVAIWAAVPALLLLAAWMPFQGEMVYRDVLASPEAQGLPDFAMQRDSILAEAREIASGQRDAGFNPESSALAPRFKLAECQIFDARRRARHLPRHRRGGACLPPGPRRLPRSHQGRAVDDGAARRRLADRRPDDARHRPVAAVRDLALLQPGQPDRIPVRHPVEPANRDARRPGRIVGRVRFGAVVLGDDLHRRDHRHDRRDPARPDVRDLPDAICARESARLDEADPRDSRRDPDRGLRLFRRIDRRSRGARLRHRHRRQFGEQRERARRGARHGHHDHPVRQLDGRRFDRRGSASDARRQPGAGRDQVRNDPQGHPSRGASRALSAASSSPSAARSARR